MILYSFNIFRDLILYVCIIMLLRKANNYMHTGVVTRSLEMIRAVMLSSQCANNRRERERITVLWLSILFV